MGIIKMNKRIIDMYNSQVISEFTDLMDEIATYPADKIERIFKSKLYIWNIIRNKDFYKLMSVWFINTDPFVESGFLILKLILDTANNDITRKTFIKSIVKKKVILTVDTIKYIDNLGSIFEKEDITTFISDIYLKPMVDRVLLLETRVEDLFMLNN